MKKLVKILVPIIILGIFLIVLLVIICIILVGFMISIMNGRFRFGFWHSVSNELVIDEEYDETFNKLIIKSDAADIYVKETNDNKFKVLCYGKKENINVESHNNQLTIEVHSKKHSFISFNNEISKIEIYVPYDYDKEFDINNKFGNIEIDDFKKANIKVEEDCGDITIKSGNQVNVHNSYGDIRVDEAVEADIKQSAGDVEIGKVKDIKVKNNYGDIKIEKVENSLNIEEDCGDVEIDDLILNKNAIIKNNFGEIKIGSTNEIYIDAKTSLGDVKVNNNYNKSDVTLKLENNCGDIKVNN